MDAHPTAPVEQPAKQAGKHRSRGKGVTTRWEKLQAVIRTLADLSVVLGLFFGAGQIVQYRNQERVRIAVDATALLYSPQFLSAYTRVMDAHQREVEVPADDLVFIANVYDNLAILYLRGVADGSILRNRAGIGLTKVLEVVQQEHWPEAATENLRKLARELEIQPPQHEPAKTQQK